MEDDEKVWILRGATVENQDNHSAIITKVVSVKDEETKESEKYLDTYKATYLAIVGLVRVLYMPG